MIRTGRLALDLAARTVEIDGKPLNVTPKEYGILELLSLRRGRTLTKEMFLDHLYGGMDEPEQKIVDVFICKLRKKIAKVTGEADIPIQTVWGQGYTLREPLGWPGRGRGRLRLRAARAGPAGAAGVTEATRRAAAALPPPAPLQAHGSPRARLPWPAWPSPASRWAVALSQDVPLGRPLGASARQQRGTSTRKRRSSGYIDPFRRCGFRHAAEGADTNFHSFRTSIWGHCRAGRSCAGRRDAA